MPKAKAKPTPKDLLSQRTRQIVALAGCLNNASRIDGFDPRQLRTCLDMLEQFAEEVRDLTDAVARPRRIATAKPKARANGAAHATTGGAQ